MPLPAGWEIIRTEFSVTMENQFGQRATGDSDVSFEEAMSRCEQAALDRKPPVYRVPSSPTPVKTIDDLF